LQPQRRFVRQRQMVRLTPAIARFCTCINAQFMPIPSYKFTLPCTTLPTKGLASHLMPRQPGVEDDADKHQASSRLSSAHLIGPPSYSSCSSYLYFKAAAKACASLVVVIRTSVVYVGASQSLSAALGRKELTLVFYAANT